ncbi:hypothetical protein GCM10023083_84160 [Streptomyces phyllanthi]
MLAIASLATGFVVAAITPSHGHDVGAPGAPGGLDADDTVSTSALDRTIADHGPAADGRTPGQGGQGDRKG